MKSIKTLSFLTFAAFTLFLLSACDKDELKIPEPADFDMMFSSFNLSNGDDLTITPIVNTAKSCTGLKILEAEYYWDGQLISRQNNNPFTLKHKIEGQSIGIHNVTIRLTYGGEGYVRMKQDHGFDFKVNVVEDLHVYTSPKFSPGKEVKNGETFRCEALLDEERTTDGIFLSKVRFAWDDQVLAEISDAPFVLEHTFTNETIGEHRLTIRYFLTGKIEENRAFDYIIHIVE